MTLSIVSTLINLFLFGIMAVSGHYPGVALAIMGIFPLLSVIGLAVAGSGNKKAGAIMVGIGSAGFIPIGLIGVFGAKKLYNEVDWAERAAWDNDY